jgi:protein phosphatase
MALFGKKKKVTVSPMTSGDNMMRYEVGNLQGIGARQRQEDSFVLVNALDEQRYRISGLMFAVCDGMGGMKEGKVASETAVQSLRNSFKSMNMNKEISAQLRNSVFLASDEVEKVLHGEGGTTVVMGIVIHEQLYYASVGDSFPYLYRDGQLYRLNREHTVRQSLYLENIRDGITEVNSCREHPQAGALEQFLGMSGFSDVDGSVRPINLHRGDIILACSDGLGATLTESEIIEALQWPVVKDECDRLEQYIARHEKINQDNYTAVLVRCV